MYVAFDSPLDQYFMRKPHALLSRALERCPIDPGNRHLLRLHLECASKELPIVRERDEAYFGAGLMSAAESLAADGILGPPPDSTVSC